MADSSGTTGPTGHTTRRTVVAAAGTAGLATALAACGGSGYTASSASSASPPAAAPSDGGMQSPSAGGGGGSAELAKTSEIPEGGGKIFAGQQVVVTQPSAGTFKGFSAVCTHAGCTVSQVQDGTIDCPCHGSKYHIADGSVAQGPATQPLAPAKISVEGGAIKLA
ncbi:Rieske (2Fe-2S) protein [Streptomyces sp. RB6PN25]|uniref:Cytochrome bc1 complex Rieske iron-sulfur subunit n=1 Tax=Streptomyces humicola TaxID=2953240 RepID=A0ABT1Q4M4_9ACTN|nr:Rieske (2Fe-2S) protein [Streptomyces humicola]MCQ4084871.1 Rieske (2Fe-2S) protein [Streptomyces humicola]